jgi:hypothetical protein
VKNGLLHAIVDLVAQLCAEERGGQESPLGVDAVEKVLGPCASNKKYWVLAPAILIQEQQWMRNMIQKFRRPDSIVACRAMAVDFSTASV